MIELDPDSPQALVGDPDDPMTPADMDSLEGQAAQDAAYDREHAAQEMLDAFLAGIAASDETSVLGMLNPAFALGERIGWELCGAIALNPELAPLWDALVR